jgi:NADH dehydrogenase [ubiquinone] 1 alpha subcomplex assembly factor 7
MSPCVSRRRADTPLALKLKERIRRQGPLVVAEYMEACLHDPEYGYYRSRPAIGAQGDFTTAPEITQAFGELVGIWVAVAWRAMGAPQRFDLIELGPGRGTLMMDALRAMRIIPGLLGALRVHLVESTSRLREVQQSTLDGVRQDTTLVWHVALEKDIAGGCPVVVLANEFLDTLPVRQLVRTNGEWAERCVQLDASGDLCFASGARTHVGTLALGRSPRDGDVVEIRDGFAELADLLKHWSGHGLAALFIDYGHASSAYGDTLQAMSGHRYVHPLELPGESDLTAQVDFHDLARRCRERGLAVDGPVTQSEFLLALGLAQRTERLITSARPDQAGLLEAGAHRVADPFGMGGRFKVVCIRSHSLPVLPPFRSTAPAQEGCNEP